MEAITIKGHLVDSMTDDEYFYFCQENETLQIERTSDYQIYIIPLIGSISGHTSDRALTPLAVWNIKNKLGFEFDSSTGFTLPDNSVLSPDAAWVSNEKWNHLSIEDLEKFAHVCPEFVIEVKSKSDRLSYLKDKMQKWITNGCHLAWLINPEDESIIIYRKDGSVEQVHGFDRKLSGENVLMGFEMDLSLLRI